MGWIIIFLLITFSTLAGCDKSHYDDRKWGPSNGDRREQVFTCLDGAGLSNEGQIVPTSSCNWVDVWYQVKEDKNTRRQADDKSIVTNGCV